MTLKEYLKNDMRENIKLFFKEGTIYVGIRYVNGNWRLADCDYVGDILNSNWMNAKVIGENNFNPIISI